MLASIGAPSRFLVIAALGATQTIAWASSYYLLAVLADPIAKDLSVSTTSIFAALSGSLVISALLAPRVGRTIDLLGGREVLALSNVLFALGLFILAISHSLVTLWIAWLLLGAAMGLGLYDAAFAALGKLYGSEARAPITGITLIAGFASTVGWPLTAWGANAIGWRYTCLAWAIVHLAIALPLNLATLPGINRPSSGDLQSKPNISIDRSMLLIGFALAAGWIVASGMAAQLPRILEAAGASTAEAIAAAALVGPGQVGARFIEAGFLHRFHPLLSARLSTLSHPAGVLLLLLGGAKMAMPFTLLHGAGNGIFTIARGTVPLAVFGPENYGYRLGLLGAPARLAQAAAPLLFGILIERYGANVLLFSSLLYLLALIAFLFVSVAPRHSSDMH